MSKGENEKQTYQNDYCIQNYLRKNKKSGCDKLRLKMRDHHMLKGFQKHLFGFVMIHYQLSFSAYHIVTDKPTKFGQNLSLYNIPFACLDNI